MEKLIDRVFVSTFEAPDREDLCEGIYCRGKFIGHLHTSELLIDGQWMEAFAYRVKGQKKTKACLNAEHGIRLLLVG